jgi:Enoyl-(Acyl carrier protein) reductase
MGRFAEAEGIAAAVPFLASDDASFVTASAFMVDGGISAAYVTPNSLHLTTPIPLPQRAARGARGASNSRASWAARFQRRAQVINARRVWLAASGPATCHLGADALAPAGSPQAASDTVEG